MPRRRRTGPSGIGMIIFLTMVGAVVLGLIIAVIYLNDRVNLLERQTQATSGTAAGGGGDDNTWHGLSGKRLWDAMTGKKGVTTLDDAALALLRQAYEVVLSKHIEALFVSGQADARRQQNNQPSSVKTVNSPRGQVQSWIPLNHANAIYRAGADSIKPDVFEVERARMALDEAAQVLFSQVGLPSAQLFSELLMPLDPPATAPAGGAAPTAGADAAGPAGPVGALKSPAPGEAGQGGTDTAARLAGAPPAIEAPSPLSDLAVGRSGMRQAVQQPADTRGSGSA